MVSPEVSPQSEPKEKKTGVCGSMHHSDASFLAGKINNSHDFQGLFGRHFQRSWLTCTARRRHGCAPRSAPRLAIIHAKQQVSVREKGRCEGKSTSSARFPGGFTAAPPHKRVFNMSEEDAMTEVHGERGVSRYSPVKIRFTRVVSARGDTLTRIINLPRGSGVTQRGFPRGLIGDAVLCAQNPGKV
jgi:hypothetical protein